jgi:hypothetical protein
MHPDKSPRLAIKSHVHSAEALERRANGIANLGLPGGSYVVLEIKHHAN